MPGQTLPGRRGRGLLRFSLWLGASLVFCLPAHAHKVITSAWADGDFIEGEIGFSNGDVPPEGTQVEVFGPGGEKLGEVSTDADGLFRFQPTEAIAHSFRSNLGAGHLGEVTLGVDELPIRLVQGGAATQQGGVDESAGKLGPAAGVPVCADLEAVIAEAVQRQVRPLRKELRKSREKKNLQDILGGIGYICGIFGLAFFYYGRRARREE